MPKLKTELLAELLEKASADASEVNQGSLVVAVNDDEDDYFKVTNYTSV